MIERATDDDHPYDAIAVHSFSRFFRDSFALNSTYANSAKPGCGSSQSRRRSVTTPPR